MYNSEQKIHLSKSTYSVLTALFYVVLSLPAPSNAQTGCSRVDIDHYLEKGFTPAQVTSICVNTGSPQEVSREKDSGQPVAQTQDTATFQPAPSESRTKQDIYRGQDSRSFFGDVIEGYDVVLTVDTLSYTRKKCYDLGEEDLFGFAPEVCPEVRYHINLNGLEILQTGRKYFLFGPSEITVKGKITREVLSGLQDLKPKGNETIKKLVGTGNEELLPIRQGTPRDRVEAELKKVIR